MLFLCYCDVFSGSCSVNVAVIVCEGLKQSTDLNAHDTLKIENSLDIIEKLRHWFVFIVDLCP